MYISRYRFIFCFLFLWLSSLLFAQQSFTVGTYNLEKFNPNETDVFKAKLAKIVETICTINADVLGLVEMGNDDSVILLKNALKEHGLIYSYSQWMSSNDHSLHLAILSRYPLFDTAWLKNDKYLLDKKGYSLKRGILKTTVRVTDSYSFTVLLTHLKSQVETRSMNQEEVRLEEAKILRQKVDQLLAEDKNADFVVMGDMNDNYSSRSIRTLVGNKKGVTRLTDARPIEQIGDTLPADRTRGKYRSVAWTHFYSDEDSYSRLDYIFYSPGLRDQFLPEKTSVVVVPNWGIASDHRPIKAGFSISAPKANRTSR